MRSCPVTEEQPVVRDKNDFYSRTTTPPHSLASLWSRKSRLEGEILEGKLADASSTPATPNLSDASALSPGILSVTFCRCKLLATTCRAMNWPQAHALSSVLPPTSRTHKHIGDEYAASTCAQRSDDCGDEFLDNSVQEAHACDTRLTCSLLMLSPSIMLKSVGAHKLARSPRPGAACPWDQIDGPKPQGRSFF